MLNTRLHLNKFLATGVGSLPHVNPKEACDLVFRYFQDDIPFWPQLPRRNFKENMYVQYSQGLPGVAIDEAAQKICIDTAKDSYAEELGAAYEHYLADDLDYFAIGADYAAGLYEFTRYPLPVTRYPFIKGQTIGPISFGLSVCDQDKKAIIYNPEFCECLLKVLAMKARWQVQKLRIPYPVSRIPQIVIFIDEPYLVSIGSSFFNIKPEEVIKMLNDLIEAIHQEGACAGIHCCGNTDWGIVLKTEVDILNFDAYNYLETIFLYRQELDNFLRRGSVLAWGIVPTTADDILPTADRLLKKLGGLKDYCLITPSCGLSGMAIERSEEILALTAETVRRLPSG